MIIDLWNKVSAYCGNHDDTEKRELILKTTNEVTNMLYYCCPDCSNRIGAPDYDRMINKIDSFAMESMERGTAVNLANRAWKNSKHTHYRITYHDIATNQMEVSVLNKMEI